MSGAAGPRRDPSGNGLEYLLHAEQTIEIGGQRSARRAVVSRALRTAELREQVARAETVARVRAAYVGAQLARARVETEGAREALVAKLLDAVQNRVQGGASSDVTEPPVDGSCIDEFVAADETRAELGVRYAGILWDRKSSTWIWNWTGAPVKAHYFWPLLAPFRGCGRRLTATRLTRQHAFLGEQAAEEMVGVGPGVDKLQIRDFCGLPSRAQDAAVPPPPVSKDGACVLHQVSGHAGRSCPPDSNCQHQIRTRATVFGERRTASRVHHRRPGRLTGAR